MTSFLNTQNLRLNADGIEHHPLIPFLPENALVLLLGSFPPQRKRWCMDFYYPNFTNDHWRIEGQVFFNDKNHFVDEQAKCFKLQEIVTFCRERRIALFDTATVVRRLQDNASDKFLEIVQPTDIPALLRHLPQCRAIATTGQKATETICAQLHIPVIPKVNTYITIPSPTPVTAPDGLPVGSPHPILLYRLPSSSRAYPLSFDKKAEAYRQLFSTINML